MRCLQCGVEMALLKKLRNSTEFCSEECRQKYEDESNQLAVSRLMQQRKPKPARAAGSPTGVVDRLPSAPVAVVAITEPPMAEFLPQTAIAEIEAHPVTGKADWQSRKGNQILPALGDDVLNSLLALQFSQLQEQYAPRGPRPALIDNLFLLAQPSLWSQAVERQTLPAPAPNLTSAWIAAWPAEWRGLIDLVRDNSETAETLAPEPETAPEATPVAPAVPAAPVIPSALTAAAPAAPIPPAAAIKVTKPSVVPAEPAQPSLVSETVAMPQPALRTPEPAMLPLRPRIAIAPRPTEPPAPRQDMEAPRQEKEAPRQEKARAVKPILVPKPAEAAKVADSPKRVEGNPAAQPSAAQPKPVEKAKSAETRIPEVRLETRRPEKNPVEEPKPIPSAQTKPADTKPAETKNKEPKAAESKPLATKPAEAAAPIAAPTFGAPPKGSAATGLWHRMPWWERCAAVAVFLLSIGGWLINGRPAEEKRSSRSISLPSPAAPAPGMGTDSWASERATDLAGAALSRQLSLYRPSKTMKDYVVEFQGTIQERALGWIVRAKDASNYYCLKLEVDRTGAAKLIRFGVIDGKEDTHTQLPLSMLPKPENGAYKVRVEAKGPKISTYINGQAVDLWVDERLPQGAAGFTNERGERAVVKSVQVSF